MANASTVQVQSDDRRQELPLDLLSELEKAHQRLSECMAEMDQVTREALPDRFRFTRARFRISSASLARRQLLGVICARLMPHVPEADAERLQALQRSDRDLMRQSAKHVATWTLDTVNADWASYCMASRELRRHMRDALDLERRVLTSLLQRYARGGPRRLT